MVEEVEHLQVDVAQRGEDPVQGWQEGPGARPRHVLDLSHSLAHQGHQRYMARLLLAPQLEGPGLLEARWQGGKVAWFNDLIMPLCLVTSSNV